MTVLAVRKSNLQSFFLSYKIQRQETTMTVLTVLVVSAVVAVSVVTATPLKLKPKSLQKQLFYVLEWEIDFYTPPVLGGAALLTIQRQRCIKYLAP